MIALSSSQVLALVQRVISEQLDVNPNDVQPEAKLIDDLGADSLALVELVLTFEEELELEDVPEEDVERIVTVRDVMNYIEKCLPREPA